MAVNKPVLLAAKPVRGSKDRVVLAADEVALDHDHRDYVSSFARGLEVIRAFSRSKPSMTLRARQGIAESDLVE